MQCPKCAHDMEKMTYKDIEVDRCTLCKGLWFDALEHEALRGEPVEVRRSIAKVAIRTEMIGSNRIDRDHHNRWLLGRLGSGTARG